MLKKMLIAAVAVLVGVAVITSSTRLGSLARTKLKNAATWARSQVPPETEIQRLRDEIERLGKDSGKHFGDLAAETVAVERLREDVSTLEAKLAQQKKNMLSLKEDLVSSEQFVVYGDRRYSKDQVKVQLKRDLDAYQLAEENLKAKRSLLEAKEAGLASARDQLKAMQDTRQMLEDKVARLEADLKKVRVAQTKSQFCLDDSELSRVKEDVAALEDRIKVEKTKLEIQAEYSHAPIPLTERVREKDLVKEIEAKFGKPDAQKVAGK